MTDNKDIKDLATRLTSSGPHKIARAGPRRIRVLFNGTWVVDTRRALYVWEHPFYPQLYVQHEDLATGHGISWRTVESGSGWKIRQLEYGSKKTTRVIWFQGEGGKDGHGLDGMVRIEFKAMDAWYEEDEPILVHPKDPFKRVDVLPSSAPIKVAVQGITLAEAPFAMHLYETGLPVRYYLPLTAVKQDQLRPSAKGTKTFCPYKGEADYYDIVLKDDAGKERVYSDLVWYYTSPNLECAGIRGLACFYNEKVEIWVDGKKDQQPKTVFS